MDREEEFTPRPRRLSSEYLGKPNVRLIRNDAEDGAEIIIKIRLVRKWITTFNFWNGLALDTACASE